MYSSIKVEDAEIDEEIFDLILQWKEIINTDKPFDTDYIIENEV